MNSPNDKTNGAEDNDLNKQEPHDPVEAGKKAIEAGEVASGGKEGQESNDKADAEKWRNEG